MDNENTIKGYIAGFFDGEGCVEHCSLSIVNTNLEILEEISYCLELLEIKNNIKPHQKKVKDNYKKAYKLRIYGHYNFVKFYAEIPIQDKVKKVKLKSLIDGYKSVTVKEEIIMRKMRLKDLSLREIGRQLNRSPETVRRHTYYTILFDSPDDDGLYP